MRSLGAVIDIRSVRWHRCSWDCSPSSCALRSSCRCSGRSIRVPVSVPSSAISPPPLAEGRGFSDPFGELSGPTTWAAPVYPFFLAAVFKTLGVKSIASFWIATITKSAALALSGCILFSLARSLNARRGAWMVVAVYLLLMCSLPWSLVYGLGDEWLLILTSSVLLASYCKLVFDGENPGILFGLLGGFCALVHPALGLVFIAFVLWPRNGFTMTRRVLMGVLSILVITPWVARNYLEFDQLIPVKGNVAFESYLGNVRSSEGVYTSEIFTEHHPANNNSTREAYLSEGETAFFDRHEKLFVEAVKSDPVGYLEKIGNRLFAIFVLDVPNLFDGEGSVVTKFAKGLLYFIPVLVVAAWIALGRYRLPRRVLEIHGIFLVSFALPFLFIGFYSRYRLGLIPAFSSILGLMVIDIARKIHRRKSSINGGRDGVGPKLRDDGSDAEAHR